MKTIILRALCGVLTLGAFAITPSSVRAEDPDPLLECYRPGELDKYKLLRRLSLDLRDRLPDYSEYEALHVLDGVPESVIDEYLSSDEFRVVSRRFHERLLWPNLKEVELTAFNFRVDNRNQPAYSLLQAFRRKSFRNSTSATCMDQPQPEDAYYVIEDPDSDKEWRVPNAAQ